MFPVVGPCLKDENFGSSLPLTGGWNNGNIILKRDHLEIEKCDDIILTSYKSVSITRMTRDLNIWAMTLTTKR
jgi:hypothetical protein